MIHSKIIRVFPRKNKWTPRDGLAFYDEPPIFDLPDLPVYVSVTFTWDIGRGRRLADAWRRRCKEVQIGGPALCDEPGEFVPGRFIKEGVTITSRGCPKRCPWCLVPQREGRLREIEVQPGYIVQDNNLLACSDGHFEEVIETLGRQRRAAEFKGGLDIDYLTEWHVDCFKRIRVSELWVACDTESALAKLDKAADLLADFSINKKRCYVLIAYKDDTVDKAIRRLETVYEKGFLPFAQFYRPNSSGWMPVPKEWHYVQRKWSRPAIYRGRK